MSLPFISAISLQYGDVPQLEDSLACFLAQDYEGESEIVILNSFNRHRLHYEHPKVRIVNLDTRPPSLADCRNLAIEHARGEIMVVWDSDDAFATWYLSTIAKHFGNGMWAWLDKQFYLVGWKIKSISPGAIGCLVFTKDAWKQVGGYQSGLNVGEDRHFVSRITTQTPGAHIDVPPEEIGFFYSWGESNYHISGLGVDKPGRPSSYERARRVLEQRVRGGKVRTGDITLKPKMKCDYGAMAKVFVASFNPRHVPITPSDGVAIPGLPVIYHAVERHLEKNIQIIARKQKAWDSWDKLYKCAGVIPCHYWEYQRSAKDIGDPIALPFLRDVLQPALKLSTDSDIVLWTNDDTILNPALPFILRKHLAKHPVVSAQRCDFYKYRTPLDNTPDGWIKASHPTPHIGRDLFAATGQWLRERWDSIPDFILGAPAFDWWMAAKVRRHYGMIGWRQTVGDAISPAELPRGYVGHVNHTAIWTKPQRQRAAATLHNARLFEHWKTAHPDVPPTIRLTPLPVRSTLHLPGVTLWSCVWSKSRNAALHDRTLRVLSYCQRIIRFQRVLFFSYLDCAAPGVEIVKIPELAGLADFNEFVNRVVPKHIKSDYAMSVHEDGFPIQPQLWSEDFLAYDYIGAPWSDGVVGNGGFYIESRRLLQAKLAHSGPDMRAHNADFWICRVHRKEFESEGIRFAPKDVAIRFSTETYGQNLPSFGFHGRRLSPGKYAAGWAAIERMESGG